MVTEMRHSSPSSSFDGFPGLSGAQDHVDILKKSVAKAGRKFKPHTFTGAGYDTYLASSHYNEVWVYAAWQQMMSSADSVMWRWFRLIFLILLFIKTIKSSFKNFLNKPESLLRKAHSQKWFFYISFTCFYLIQCILTAVSLNSCKCNK